MFRGKVGPRLTACLEIAGFVCLLIILKALIDPFVWRFAGPISLISTLCVLTIYLRLRNRSWRQIGFARLDGPRPKLLLLPQTLLVFAGFAAVIVALQSIVPALGLTFMDEVPAGVEDRWGGMRGNLPAYLLWLGVVWVSAAFGEEMFFRGFLITQMQTALEGIPGRASMAVILPAILFGVLHYYNQDLRGAVTAGTIGLVFGTLFLLFKRNLWPLILCHGLIDTIGMTAIYLNLEG